MSNVEIRPRSDAAVSQASRMLELKAEEDKDIKKMMKKIEIVLRNVVC